MARKFTESDRDFAAKTYAESIAAGKQDIGAGMKTLSKILFEGPGTRAENLKLAESAQAQWDRDHS
jgi:hypothetical protein